MACFKIKVKVKSLYIVNVLEIVICLPTEHLGVHENSLKRVLAFHIELELLVLKERGKPDYPKKNLSEQEREPTTN